MRFSPNTEARYQLMVDSGDGTKVVVGLEDYQFNEVKNEAADFLVIHHSKVSISEIESHISNENILEAAQAKQQTASFPKQYKIKDQHGNEMIKILDTKAWADIIDEIAEEEGVDRADVTDELITDQLQGIHDDQVANGKAVPNPNATAPGPTPTPHVPVPAPVPPRDQFKSPPGTSDWSVPMPDGSVKEVTADQWDEYVTEIGLENDIEYKDVTVAQVASLHQGYLADVEAANVAKSELANDFNQAEFDDWKFNEWDAPDEINQPRVQMSDTALELDMWSRHQGHILAEQCEKLSPYLKSGDLDPLAIADFNAACFEPESILCQEELVSPEVRHRYEFMKNLLEQPEFRALHEQTQLNSWASEAATSSIVAEYVVLKKKEEEEQEGDGPGDKPGNKPGKSGQGGAAGAGTGKGSGKEKVTANPMAHEIRQIRAISKAVIGAQKEVDNASDIAGAFGFSDLKDGNNNLDRKALSEVFKRCQKDRMLAKIAEFAGKYRRLARSKQRNKLIHGNEESVGITLGGQVNRLLKSQLGRLMLPQTRLRQMNTILQKQALQKNKKARATVSKGPIMLMVDESGSMSGDRIMQAKGLCLAMAWLAKTQKRWFCAVGFASRGEVCHLVLDPQRNWPADKLMEWCGHFFSGGTEPPLGNMADIYAKTQAPVGKTDLIFITDGDVCVRGDDKESFLKWKKEAHCRVITLFIQSRANGTMAEVSDDKYEVRNLDVSSDGVEAVVSI